MTGKREEGTLTLFAWGYLIFFNIYVFRKDDVHAIFAM